MFRKVKKVMILIVFIFFALFFVTSSAFADRGIVLALSLIHIFPAGRAKDLSRRIISPRFYPGFVAMKAE